MGIKPIADYPVTFQQELLILLDAFLPDGGFLSHVENTLCLNVRGPLDVDRLTAALQELIVRHHALRTTIEEANGEWRQIVWPPQNVALPVIDIEHAEPRARQTVIREIVMRDAGLAFAASDYVRLRARLIRLADADHVLTIVAHHLVTDGWSMGVINRDLWTLYAADDGTTADVPPPKLQYSDYAVAQRRDLTSRIEGERLTFWSKLLDGRSFTTVGGERSLVWRVTLTGDDASRLKQVARANHATPFMVLVSLFFSLVAGTTGSGRLTIPVLSAERDQMELFDLVGMVADVFVISLDVDLASSFDEFLQHVRRYILGNWRSRLPIVRMLAGIPHLSGNLLRPGDERFAPVFVNYLASPDAGAMAVGELKVEPYDWREGGVAQPFETFLTSSFTVWDNGQTLLLEALGDRWLVEQLPVAIELVTATPSAPLRDLVG